MDILNRLCTWRDMVRARRERSQREELRAKYNVEERDGELWIVCGTMPIYLCPRDYTIEDALRALNDTRRYAEKYYAL